ncbi:universal stress protein [Limimaricola hongkongensis]|uniref:Universal stress protein family protein n=1 Tax=Limimaricola hongkongensis DSM 17492 TaxID=1122180 RepID=A0A017HF84_9RHOB|nr:universal stress protein [Limimaricola hongkongensis]EYD72823.1 universal stress protein family protein [Limimaricola hongkongensis DSM 17492]
MTIRTIALCFTDPAQAETLAQAGAALAREKGAHLLGLYVLPDPQIYPAVSLHITGEILSQIRDRQRAAALEVQARFEARLDAEGVVGEWRCLEAKYIPPVERMVESVRAADLVMVGRPDGDRAGHGEEEIIRASGRPVLMIPPGWEPAPLGRAAVIGWSETREAARAAHDAVDLLEDGAEVTLLSIAKQPENDEHHYPAQDMATMLSRHGLSATVVHRAAGQSKISEILEREAFRTGAGVIVTGAFGHSRAYDFVLGTVTWSLLRGAKRPVLFSK